MRKNKFWVIIVAILLFFFITINSPVEASTNPVTEYKNAIIKITKRTGDEDNLYNYKIKRNNHGQLSVKFDTDDSGYNYDLAIEALQKAELNDVSQVVINTDEDKYTFDLGTIRSLDLSKRNVIQHAKSNEPGDYSDYKTGSGLEKVKYDYIEDTLFPQAVSHIEKDDE